VAFTTLYVMLGDVDAAFDWLEQAYRDRRGWLAYLNIEPLLDGIRSDPRFSRLLERLQLV
jgi:hypothetical protein